MRLSIITLALLCLTATARGILITSLPYPQVDASVSANYNQWLATSFAGNPDAEEIFIESLTLRMNVAVPNANTYVAIVRGKASRPDLNQVVLEFETQPLIDAVPGQNLAVELEPLETLSRPALQGNQTYWIVLGATAPDPETLSSGLFYWSYTTQSGPYPLDDGWSLGTSIAGAGTGGTSWIPETNTPYSFALTAVPVPEPSVGLLLVVGGVVLMFTSRRRKS